MDERVAEAIKRDSYAASLGVEFVLLEDDHAVTRLPLTDGHLNFLGGVHGGAIFSLADVAFSAASNSDGNKSVAIHVSIDFLAAPGDTPYLEADVRETARAGRVGHYAMEISNAAGDTVAVCHGWVYHTNRPLLG